jgi:CCR4-NOT transcription complex subunit 3
MAARKTQQEIEKTFKKVSEGIQTFEGIYEKIRQATNPTQRDKLEDHLKREIKKLQRFRDQIKSWAAGNEVKDKAPLMEQRKAIEVVRFGFLPWSTVIVLKGQQTNTVGSAWNNSRPSKKR